MTTIKELKQFLNNFNDEERFFISIVEDDELNCELCSENDIIDHANNIGGVEDGEPEIEDLDTALSYLSEMDSDRYYYELDI